MPNSANHFKTSAIISRVRTRYPAGVLSPRNLWEPQQAGPAVTDTRHRADKDAGVEILPSLFEVVPKGEVIFPDPAGVADGSQGQNDVRLFDARS